jgi:hypothetical protein
MGDGKQLLPGFNHNVRRQGRLYHVQTEDSGVASPHVTTQLFLGGTVLASTRTSYADALDDPDLATRVRQLMETQHKAMLRALVAGELDAGAPANGRADGDAAPIAAPSPVPVPAASAPGAAASAASAPTAPLSSAAATSAPPAPVSAAAPAPRPPPAEVAPAAPRSHVATPPVDGWGPPVLPRIPRTSRAAPARAPAPPPPPAMQAAPPETPEGRRLDDLVLAYLAEDLATKGDANR